MLHAMRPRRRLAPYACDPERSRGRLHGEADSPTRTAFQRDRDRIIHSAAFRRLKHKTQVFVYHEGDHYRTRLTHSIEVSQVARSLARSLAVDEDLAEALALAHDLGHPPFGHAGERALARCMASHGGFDHNAQSLAVVTRLENRYAAFDGLNLSWETLEGLVKHNGPLVDDAGHAIGAYEQAGIPSEIVTFSQRFDLRLESFASLEAQCAAISDDIAYNSHDIDDGLRAGLFTIDDIAGAVPMVGSMVADIRATYPAIDAARLQHEVVRRLITALIEDVLEESSRRISAFGPRSPDDVRGTSEPVAGFSAGVAGQVEALRAFLFARMYRHERVMRVMGTAEQAVTRIFKALLADPSLLPDEWQATPSGGTARAVADYIAGMTDRYALAEHRRLFDEAPELR
jgi:dGTPase